MRILTTILAIAFLAISCHKEKNKTGTEEIKIIPLPNSIEYGLGTFRFSEKTVIQCTNDEETGQIASLLAKDIFDRTGLKPKLDKSESSTLKTNGIFLKLIDVEMDKGSYTLDVSSRGVTIKASSHNGLFYGTRSLIQLFPVKPIKKDIDIPVVIIDDSPRYEWRGIMLDESRHFFGKEKVKQLLDMMALHKLNKFHWHLTDEPAWRIEIKKYPKLATIGGKGSWSNPDVPPNYYTQDDIKEVVSYAARRYIEIIPEIDMPGHASASNRAYPRFSGGGSEDHPHFTFNPGKEEVYGYLTDILKEVKALFPSRYVHIGGDEVSFGNQQWAKDPYVKQLMKEKKLQDLKEVEAYFVDRMVDTLVALERRLVGWDEIAESDKLRKGSVVMWWRHDKPEILKKSLQKGYPTIICPRIPYYFDFNQHEDEQYGRTWGGSFSDLKTGYEYPGQVLDSLPDKENILGLQANLWTERIDSEQRLDYLTYPRMSALAEAAWTFGESKDYASFSDRLKYMMKTFDAGKIYYFNPFNPKSTPEPKGPQKPNWQKVHR